LKVFAVLFHDDRPAARHNEMNSMAGGFSGGPDVYRPGPAIVQCVSAPPMQHGDLIPDCPERVRLSNDVSAANSRVRNVRNQIRLAVKDERFDFFLARELAEARATEGAAVAALERHRKAHGC
jgi:hypothetical protein